MENLLADYASAFLVLVVGGLLVERATEIVKRIAFGMIEDRFGVTPAGHWTILIAAVWGIFAAWGLGLDMAVMLGLDSNAGAGIIFTGFVLSGGAAGVSEFFSAMRRWRDAVPEPLIVNVTSAPAATPAPAQAISPAAAQLPRQW